MKLYPGIFILYGCWFFRGSSEESHSLSRYLKIMIIISVFTVSALLYLSHAFVLRKTYQMTLIPEFSFLGHLSGWEWNHSLESNRTKWSLTQCSPGIDHTKTIKDSGLPTQMTSWRPQYVFSSYALSLSFLACMTFMTMYK